MFNYRKNSLNSVTDTTNNELNIDNERKIKKMKVLSISYPIPLSAYDRHNAKIDIRVELEDGKVYSPAIATFQWVRNEMQDGFLSAGTPIIIIKELDEKIIQKAVFDYAEDDAWWLKVYSLEYGQELKND